MCGIVGIRRFDGGPVSAELLRAMTACQAHRGPDDEGVWIDGDAGFGHARLSIIDVDGSRQPMRSDDGTLVITFNGEILNYHEIRRGLEYPFRTSGDTETLLAAHARRGTAILDDLRGQFAYALFDASNREVLLVRDRLGILPLYYYVDQEMLAFASEVKALLPALPHSPAVDERSVGDYLIHRAVPAPDTLFAGVKKLPPGCVLRASADGEVDVRRYWTLGTPATTVDGREAVPRLRGALVAAVEEALVADVPVGAYLSGGLDSSLIAALAVEQRGDRRVDTFSAGFGDPRFDETRHARHVSSALGTRHHEVTVSPGEFTTLWSELTWHRDGPLSEPADVAVFRLATLAREHVKVVLSGEGSDELFGGYPKYRLAGLAAAVAPLRGRARGATLGGVAELLPPSAHRLRVALKAMAEPSEFRQLEAWFAPFTPRELDGFGVERHRMDAGGAIGGDPIDRMLRHDITSWLPDNLLERGDRMSMAASLELRPPFLDHRVVELAFAMPSRLKVHRGTTKWVVKEVARSYLPAEIVDRPKAGFRVPLDAWFRGAMREMAWDMLAAPGSFATQVLDRKVVHGILRDHDRGRRNEALRIFTLLGLEVWHDRFFGDGARRTILRQAG
jgi:asparagine synthase (glutamine-hydrolysing)